MLLFADNLDFSIADSDTGNFTALSLSDVALRCSVSAGLQEASTYFQQMVDNGARGFVRAGSLAFAVDNAPADLIDAFVNYLEFDTSRAESVVKTVVDALQLVPSVAPTVLRILAAPSLHLPTRPTNYYNPVSTSVHVAVLRVRGLTANRALHTCVALSKLISLTRDAVWNLKDRVMVLCLSAHHCASV